MLKLLKEYFVEKWWIPTVVFFASMVLCFATLNIEIFPSYSIGFFGFIVLFVGGLLQLFNRKWLIGMLNLGLFFGIIFMFIIFLLSFWAMFGSDNDTFADDLKLPENIKLEKPIDKNSTEYLVAIKSENTKQTSVDEINFQLYNSFQPGLYEYDVWVNSNQNGTIFLKAYEITQETALSTSPLKERSSIQINNTKNITEKFSTKNHFTIYEGDWGKPYGARFEIWFKPDDNQKERKLFEKNYIIEGWMR